MAFSLTYSPNKNLISNHLKEIVQKTGQLFPKIRKIYSSW